jgi:hypothetical protein
LTEEKKDSLPLIQIQKNGCRTPERSGLLRLRSRPAGGAAADKRPSRTFWVLFWGGSAKKNPPEGH